jgi:hypothetical protein
MNLNFEHLSPVDKILLNAVITAGIVFFSTLSVSYPPAWSNIYAAGIGAMMAIFTQLKTLTTSDDDGEPKIRPPGMGLLV